MAKKNGPYVGVTGFMSRREVCDALAMVPEGSTRRLMVGVLMSSKTLAGEQNKWPGRYPKKEVIAGIFVSDPQTLNLIHYNTDDPETLCTQLMEVTELAGPHLDGFQLNIAWPPIAQLKEYREAHPEQFFVLQIGSKAMEQMESLGEFTKRVGAYLPMIDAILIDPSGGRGVPLNAATGAAYLRAVSCFQTLGPGIAGGLGPDTLHLLDRLVKDFPELSIDAEGQLRTRQPEDALCLDAMRTYLEDAFPILAGKKLPGWKLRQWSGPYGFEEHVRRYGLGHNMLRTTRLAQPRALKVGDILGTGDRVLSPPREGGNGAVWLHLTGGFDGHWMDVPARIPIALLTEEDKAPEAVWKHGEK